jgi:hypothetical protein
MRKKIKVKKFKEFVSFSSLIDPFQEWGREFTDEKEMKDFKKSPSFNSLFFGILVKIWKELKNIREELKRERLIK